VFGDGGVVVVVEQESEDLDRFNGPLLMLQGLIARDAVLNRRDISAFGWFMAMPADQGARYEEPKLKA
jgi:hypothetical protein